MKALKFVLLFILISWGVFSAIYIFSTENSSPEDIVTPDDSVRAFVDTIAIDPIIEKAREGYRSLTTKGLDLTFEDIENLNQFKTQNDEFLRSCQDTDVKNFYAMIPEYYSFVDALKNNNLRLLNIIDGYKLSDVHKELLEKLKDKRRSVYGEELIRRILPVNSFRELEKKLNLSKTQSPQQGSDNISGGTAGSSNPSSTQKGNTCKYCKIKFNTPRELDSHLKTFSGRKMQSGKGETHPHYYKCDRCNKTFDKQGELTQHRQENH